MTYVCVEVCVSEVGAGGGTHTVQAESWATQTGQARLAGAGKALCATFPFVLTQDECKRGGGQRQGEHASCGAGPGPARRAHPGPAFARGTGLHAGLREREGEV